MIDIVYEHGWAEIGAIAIDATLREVHKFAGDVTEHPVETGGNLSDHYRPAPRAVQLEGVITDTPIRVPRTQNNGATIVQKTFDIPTELFGMQLGPIPVSIPGISKQGSVSTFSTVMERVKSTWEEFEAIFEQQKIISIVTTLRTYTDMALTDLEIERRPGSIRFNCLAVQIRTVSSGRVATATIPKIKRAVPVVEKGKQSVTPEPVAANSSFAAKLAQRAADFFSPAP